MVHNSIAEYLALADLRKEDWKGHNSRQNSKYQPLQSSKLISNLKQLMSAKPQMY
jgi:hypothetical protein